MEKVPGGTKTKTMPTELVKDLSEIPGDIPWYLSQAAPPKANKKKQIMSRELPPTLCPEHCIS
jgi:hypothetical protein